MVKHIVLFKVKEGENVARVVKIAEAALMPLVGKIEGLLSAEIKQTFAGMDIALYCELESKEAMAYYADHPLHTEAKSKFFHLLSDRVAADYEV